MNRRDFNLLTKVISGKAGVSIQELPQGQDHWSSDPEKKIIYYPTQYNYTEEDLGIALHESGHIRFSGLSELAKEDMDKIAEQTKVLGVAELFKLINALEDIRIEALMSQVYAGARYYFRHTALKYFNLSKLTEKNSELTRHYCLYFLYKYGLTPDYGAEYLANLGLDTDKRLTDAIDASERGVEDIFTCKDTDAVLELIKTKLLEPYLTLIDPSLANDKQRMARAKEEIIKALTEMIKAMAEAFKEATGKGKIDGGVIKGGKTTLKEVLNNTEIDMRDIDLRLAEEIKNYLADNTASIRKAISIIKDKDLIRSAGNYDSGKLITKRLYKIRAKNYRVFTKPDTLAKSDNKLAFALLIDESGSMFDDNKIEQAIKSASLLGEGLKQAGKPYAVLGFAGGYHIHKTFSDKHLDAEGYAKIKQFAYTNKEYGGASHTSDAYALSQAVKVFDTMPDYKKILIVLSDGQPAPHSDFRHLSTLEEAQKAEAKLNYVFAVGICDHSVEKFYKNNTVINDANELPSVIAELFKRVVGKRVR